MKTLIATQAVSFSDRGSLYINAATNGSGPVWANNLGNEYVEAVCINLDDTDLICSVAFKNPLYVPLLEACSDPDAPGAKELIRLAAIAAIERNDKMMLRCAIEYRERLLNDGRADSTESQAATKFVKDHCRKMDIDFDAPTLAKYGSVRYNNAMNNILVLEHAPVSFPFDTDSIEENSKNSETSQDVSLSQNPNFKEKQIETLPRNMPMPAHVPNAEWKAMTDGLKEMTAMLDSGLPPPEEPSKAEYAQRASAKEARKALDASKFTRTTQFMDGNVISEDNSLARAKNKSLSSAFGIGTQRNSCEAVDPNLDNSFYGKVLGVTEHHVVLSLGRSALVVSQSDIDRVPAAGEDVDLMFTGGKGVLSPVKAVGVER